MAAIADGPGGATSLVKSGTGWWLIGGNNTYTGGTVVNGGILDCYAQAAGGTGGTNIPMPLYNTSLGAATNTVTVNAGGAIALWGNAYAPWITTQALVTLNGGMIVGEDGYEMLNAPSQLYRRQFYCMPVVGQGLRGQWERYGHRKPDN